MFRECPASAIATRVREGRELSSTPAPQQRWRRTRAARAVVALTAAIALTTSGLTLPSGALPTVSALPCPDGSQTCGPQPTFGPAPTQAPVPTTAPHAPNTTVPGYTPEQPPQATQNGGPQTPTFQGNVPTMQTPDSPETGVHLQLRTDRNAGTGCCSNGDAGADFDGDARASGFDHPAPADAVVRSRASRA